MTQPPGPERRRVAGQFITMDAAMLAQQNERLEELNTNILRLAEAVDTRPTREELRLEARKNNIRRAAVALLVAFIFAGFLYQQQEINDVLDSDRANSYRVCTERNEGNVRFSALLARIIQTDEDQSSPLIPIFEEYRQGLMPVDCEELLLS